MLKNILVRTYKHSKTLPVPVNCRSSIVATVGRYSTMGSTKTKADDVRKSQWEESPAVFDFRSDTLTTPTPRQFNALHSASLGDDVYQESTTTTSFEARMASLLSKPEGIFVLSGTMGNQLSLRALLTQPPHSVLCDHRAHVLHHEAGGLAMLSQSQIQPVVPSNEKYLTMEDIQAAAVLDDNIHLAPTKVISLENTLGGNVLPLEEVQRIGKWARENGLKMHLDGARLWNAVSAFDTVEEQLEQLKAYSKEFDTVTVCFSKSIGAPVGSIIVSQPSVISRVRHFRKAVGGGIRQAGILTAMAEAAVEEVFLAGKLKGTNERAKRIAEFWIEKCGGKLQQEVETNMVWLDLKARRVDGDEFVEECGKAGVKVAGWGRIVVHWQNSDEAVDKLCQALTSLVKRVDERIASGGGDANGSANSHSHRGYAR